LIALKHIVRSYHSEVLLLVGPRKDVGEYLGKRFKTELPKFLEGGGCSFTMERAYIVVIECSPKKLFKLEYLALLSHELLHCTFAILKDVGFTHSSDSEEAYTYLLQELMVSFLDAVKNVD